MDPDDLLAPPSFTSVLLTSDDLRPHLLLELDFVSLGRLGATCAPLRAAVAERMAACLVATEPLTPPAPPADSRGRALLFVEALTPAGALAVSCFPQSGVDDFTEPSLLVCDSCGVWHIEEAAASITGLTSAASSAAAPASAGGPAYGARGPRTLYMVRRRPGAVLARDAAGGAPRVWAWPQMGVVDECALGCACCETSQTVFVVLSDMHCVVGVDVADGTAAHCPTPRISRGGMRQVQNSPTFLLLRARGPF